MLLIYCVRRRISKKNSIIICLNFLFFYVVHLTNNDLAVTVENGNSFSSNLDLASLPSNVVTAR